MIARVTRFQVNLDKLDETRKTIEESVIPAVKLQKGYRSSYLLIDRKTGKCITIALWDSEDDAIADEHSGHYQERVDKGKHLFTAPPVREGYEVVVQD